MNIAIIVNSFPSLSEKFLLNQFVGLLNENINIDIYASVKSDEIHIHNLYYEYEFYKYTYQVNIPRSKGQRIKKTPKIFIKNIKYSLKNTLKAFSFTKYQRAAKNLKTLYFLDAFRGKKYDIIHCHFGQNGLIGAYLKDCGFTKRLIVTFHGSDITVFPKKEGKNVYKYMFTKVDAVTAGTNFTAKQIVSYGCPKDKIHIIPAGILINKSHTIDYHNKDKNLILSVGRLEEVKGFNYAIYAIEKIINEFPNIKYYIVGNGSKKELLEHLIKEKHLDKNVFLLGEKKDVEIEELYKSASIFIAPSIRASNGSEEGQGLVIQEAELYGIPVIATNTGGIPDGVIDTVTGFLVPEKNFDAIAEKLRILLTNTEQREMMGKNGYNFVSEKYDINLLTKKLIGIYKCLL